MIGARPRWEIALATALAAAPVPLSAQRDTVATPEFHLDRLVVVAHRRPAPLAESVAATTLLTRSDIEGLQAGNLWEVLQHVPGLSFVDRDGSGQLPMALARGFFGGGETSYVLLLIDGVPANDTRTGVVEWNQIPLSAVERVEIVRGSSSVVHGDAALGAVVNVVTAASEAEDVRLSVRVSGGSWGEASFAGMTAVPLGSARLTAHVNRERTSGFREHATADRITGATALRSALGEGGFVRARLSATRLENDEPGALAPDDLARDRRSAHPAFGADRRVRWATEAVLGVERPGPSGTLDLDLRARIVDQERVRTLLLTPSFGDTQSHDEQSWSAWSRALYTGSAGAGTVTVGAEGEAATYRSRYCDPSACGEPIREGRGRLLRGALHGEIVHPLHERVLLSAGSRLDVVRPEDIDPAAPPPPVFSQWSPRLAVNVTYRRREGSTGRAFGTWTRAFKSPTLDQMYDVRLIPSGEPGVSFNLSFPELRPQRSSSLEVGAFQKVPLGAPGRFAEVSAAAYDQRLDDEIDFDVRSFRYGNILRSRHRGVELGIRLRLSNRLLATQSVTVGSATFRSGPYEGNQVKNVPRRVLAHHLEWEPVEGARIGASHRGLGVVYLDDANEERLEGANLFDGTLSVDFGRAELTLVVRNVLDTRFESLGFLLFDPEPNQNVRMVYPGGGRYMRLGLAFDGSRRTPGSAR